MTMPLSRLLLVVASILLSLLLSIEQAGCFSIRSSNQVLLLAETGTTVRRALFHTGGGESCSNMSLQVHEDVIFSTASTTTTTTTTTHKQQTENKVTTPLPPVIQQIANERQEFHINLGRAMDTLRRDMPEILHRQPDLSIYHSDIALIDPSGVQLTGLDKYKSALQFLQTFVQFWFSSSSSSRSSSSSSSSGGGGGLQYRMVYDFCRSSIRISWNVCLVPKFVGKPVFIDGISLYKLDSQSGKIIQHKVEKLIINNTPVAPPYGIFSLLLLQNEGAVVVQPVPVGLAVATATTVPTARSFSVFQ